MVLLKLKRRKGSQPKIVRKRMSARFKGDGEIISKKLQSPQKNLVEIVLGWVNCDLGLVTAKTI